MFPATMKDSKVTMAFPDVCKTPVPPTVVVAIPYPLDRHFYYEVSDGIRKHTSRKTKVKKKTTGRVKLKPMAWRLRRTSRPGSMVTFTFQLYSVYGNGRDRKKEDTPKTVRARFPNR